MGQVRKGTPVRDTLSSENASMAAQLRELQLPILNRLSITSDFEFVRIAPSSEIPNFRLKLAADLINLKLISHIDDLGYDDGFITLRPDRLHKERLCALTRREIDEALSDNCLPAFEVNAAATFSAAIDGIDSEGARIAAIEAIAVQLEDQTARAQLLFLIAALVKQKDLNPDYGVWSRVLRNE